MTPREQVRRDAPVDLYVYYCPVCKVGTGERSWHSLRDGGLIPQADTEHDCVKIDVSALLVELEQAEQREAALVEALRPFTEWNFDKEPSPLPPITLLLFREDQERARAALAAQEQAKR